MYILHNYYVDIHIALKHAITEYFQPNLKEAMASPADCYC